MTAGRLLIFADDYGLGEEHDRVMRDLLAMEAIDGVSVLVESCSSTSAAALAASLRPSQRVGLHFNLTLTPQSPTGGGPRSLHLIRSAISLSGSRVSAALESQWNAFVSLFGRPPDYIDGHEHCHAFLGIDRIVIDYARRKNVPIRSMIPIRQPRAFKERIIAALGTRVHRLATRNGVRTNDRFIGVLPLKSPERALSQLAEDIAAAEEWANTQEGEIWLMVHPGSADDPVQISGHPARLREAEAAFLKRKADSLAKLTASPRRIDRSKPSSSSGTP